MQNGGGLMNQESMLLWAGEVWTPLPEIVMVTWNE